MVATLPTKPGTRVRAIRTAPGSGAADAGWTGAVIPDRRNVVAVRYTSGIPADRTSIDQIYELSDWTTENVEILEGQ